MKRCGTGLRKYMFSSYIVPARCAIENGAITDIRFSGSCPIVSYERMLNQFNFRYVIFLACTAALGGLLFGFDIAIITGAGPFLTEHFVLNDIGLGVAFSSLLFGCVLGSFFAGRVTDRYGRKRLLVWVALLFALTSVATAVAPSFPLFVLARILGGLAVGAVSLLSPMYVAEVSPPSIRGRMGTFYQLSIIIGILISYCINYLLRNTGPDNWRWMFLSGVAPSALFFILIALAPETPRFLVKAGKTAQAFVILERIVGTESARLEIAAITASMHHEQQAWRGLLRPGVRRALFVSACLAVLIHVSGVNTVIDYAPSIFQSAGWKIDGALLSTFVVGLTELLFTLVAFAVIDRYGRKPLYIVGSLGMAATLTALLVTVLLDRFHARSSSCSFSLTSPSSQPVSAPSSGRSFPRFFPTMCAASR
jgi:SP family arabinose:H+ symporter-like MFS transporter